MYAGCKLHKAGFPGNQHMLRGLMSRSVIRCFAVALGLSLGLTGCLLLSEDRTYQSLVEQDKNVHRIYKLYPGIVRPKSNLSIVQLGDTPAATIDGLSVQNSEYQEIHLLPGRHILTWRKEFGFSVMVESSMHREAALSIPVELRAGHTYKLFADRTHGTGYRFYFWIEDVASGDVLGGKKKP